jgi:hypothetical protein
MDPAVPHLIAAAFGVLGLVIKATVFIVLRSPGTLLVLGYIGTDGSATGEEADQGDGTSVPPTQPPTRDYRY